MTSPGTDAGAGADTFELVVREARLSDGRVVDLGVSAGRYAALAEPGTLAGEEQIDAGGRLVTESFVNGHLHLEKVYTLPRVGDEALTAYTSGSMGGAMRSIELAAAVKADYDPAWIMPNVRRALDLAVLNGVLHLQVFVDVDTSAGLTGMSSVLEVRQEYADLLDLQIVAFPQQGLLRDPGAAELCEAALAEGADVVGGIPWIEFSDSAARAHVDWACRLAAGSGRRVAMLVDDAGDPSLRTTELLAESMLEHGLVGRGVACHARAVGLYPQPSQLRLITLARAAGLGFVSDPHTGPLHLPVRAFAEAGLAVALGQDDIEDAYYPFGRNNMLEVAFLAAHQLGFVTAVDQLLLLELITTRAAAVLGIHDHRIAIGNRADLCVHDEERLVDVLREHAAPRWVVRAGRIIAESESSGHIRR